MTATTSLSLLVRAADSTDAESWDRLTSIYVPLMRQWLNTYDVQPSDADDLIQDVLAVLLRELPSFEHNERIGAFRNWLRRILVNRLRNLRRSRRYEPQPRGTSSVFDQLDQLEDDHSEGSRIWNAEHDRRVLAQLIELVRPRFQYKTWEAFRRQVLEGERPDTVASALQMPLNSVYVARSRVLSALRGEASGIVDML